jgi:hypothetical protein
MTMLSVYPHVTNLRPNPCLYDFHPCHSTFALFLTIILLPSLPFPSLPFPSVSTRTATAPHLSSYNSSYRFDSCAREKGAKATGLSRRTPWALSTSSSSLRALCKTDQRLVAWTSYNHITFAVDTTRDRFVSMSCDRLWDGVDFTPCFIDR